MLLSCFVLIINSGHPNVSMLNMYTFLWLLRKSRNEALFGIITNKPLHVYATMKAILQEPRSEDTNLVPKLLAAPTSAWTSYKGSQHASVGLGVFIQNPASHLTCLASSIFCYSGQSLRGLIGSQDY